MAKKKLEWVVGKDGRHRASISSLHFEIAENKHGEAVMFIYASENSEDIDSILSDDVSINDISFVNVDAAKFRAKKIAKDVGLL